MNIYFDVETEGFDPKIDKIITIQYQELDYNGKPKGNLIILKEWESSEEEIIKIVYNELIIKDKWNWVIIGTNMIFDLTFLFEKFKKYNLPLKKTLSEYLYDKPLIDIKSALIMANNLDFRGSGLDKMTNKESNGKIIPEYYKNKEYSKIEEYIKQETYSFTEFFQKIIHKLKELKDGADS